MVQICVFGPNAAVLRANRLFLFGKYSGNCGKYSCFHSGVETANQGARLRISCDSFVCRHCQEAPVWRSLNCVTTAFGVNTLVYGATKVELGHIQ